MQLRSMLFGFLLCFGVISSAFAVTCDTGFSYSAEGWPGSGPICRNRDNGDYYYLTTMIGRNGERYYPVSPTATGYVPPAPPAPAGPQTAADLVSLVNFSGVALGILAVFGALLALAVLRFGVQMVINTLWADSPAGRLEARLKQRRAAAFRDRSVRKAYSGFRSARRRG